MVYAADQAGVAALHMASQAGPGAGPGAPFSCAKCGKAYRHQPSLWKHRKYECGQTPRFACPLCPHRAKRKHHLVYHLQARHGGKPGGKPQSGGTP